MTRPGGDTLVRRILGIGANRAAFLGARALLYVTLATRLPAGPTGTVAVLLALSAAFGLLVEIGASMVALQQASARGEDVGPELGGLLVLRAAAGIPVLAVYTFVARTLLPEEASLGLTLSIGAYAVALQVAQAGFLALRGLGRAHVEGAAGIALHGVEALWTVAWATGSHDVALLFGPMAALRLALIAALAVALGHRGARPSPSRAVRMLIESRTLVVTFAVVVVAQFVYGQSDTLVLRAFRPAEEVGEYFAAYRVILIAMLPIDLVLAAAQPVVARTAADAAKRRRVIDAVHGLGLTLLLPTVGFLIVEAQRIVELTGGGVGGPTMLRALAVAIGVGYLPPFAATLLLVEARGPAVALGVAAAVNVGANLVLVPPWGALGAAGGTLLAYVAMRLAVVRVARRVEVRAVPFEHLPAPCLSVGAWVLLRAAASPPLAASAALLGLATAGILWFRRRALWAEMEIR